jgi:hypothetical protein
VLLEITSPEEALVATIVRAGKRVFGKYRQWTMHRVRTGRARDRDVHVGWKVTDRAGEKWLYVGEQVSE